MMSQTTRHARSLATLLCVALVTACGGSDGGDPFVPDPPDPPPPPTAQPGDLTARLTTPNADDAAIQFTATGTGTQGISGVAAACSGCTLFSKTVSGTEVRGVIVGAFTSGSPFLTLTVSDRNSASAFAVSIVATTNAAFEVRGGSGYSVAVGS